jgi:hypothetical protein
MQMAYRVIGTCALAQRGCCIITFSSIPALPALPSCGEGGEGGRSDGYGGGGGYEEEGLNASPQDSAFYYEADV